MSHQTRRSVLQRLQRGIEAHVYRRAARDLYNRLRFGNFAPLSAMAIHPRPRDITQSYDGREGGRKLGRQQSGSVLGGDWDIYRQDLIPFTNKKLVSCQMRWSAAPTGRKHRSFG